MTIKVPPNEPERDPDLRHFADLDSALTRCGLARAAVRWTDDPATPIECPPCARTLPLVPPCDADWHYAIPSSGACPTCGAGSLADVSSWAATTDAELEERLRASRTYVDRVLGGLDAATPAAADLADMVARTGLHYDPGTLERLTLCDLNVPELAQEDVTTALAAVTCPTCSAGLVDSQLPPEPVERRLLYPRFAPDAELVVDMHNGPEQWTGAEWNAYVEAAARDRNIVTARLIQCPSPIHQPVEPPVEDEHRTVGLEVLTDEHRGHGTELRVGKVGIVLRLNGEVVLVPEVDTMWTADYRGPADILCVLLKQARLYADGGIEGDVRAELLMPGPEVLAALASQPVGSYTKPVPSSYGYVQPGWFVLVETVVQGRGDFVWLLVESREECKDWRDCAVAGGQDGVCHVVTVRGRGIQHLESWRPVHVRIPASTEVELP